LSRASVGLCARVQQRHVAHHESPPTGWKRTPRAACARDHLNSGPHPTRCKAPMPLGTQAWPPCWRQPLFHAAPMRRPGHDPGQSRTCTTARRMDRRAGANESRPSVARVLKTYANSTMNDVAKRATT
jgi:hypothetical protein